MARTEVVPEWAAWLRRLAAAAPRRIVFTQPESDCVLTAAVTLAREGLAHPILLGDSDSLRGRAAESGLSLARVTITAPGPQPDYLDLWHSHWASQGIRQEEAKASLLSRLHFAEAMVLAGHASAIVYGPRREEQPLLQPRPAEDQMRFFLAAASGGCLVAEPTGMSPPAPSRLSDMALSLMRIARRLFGADGRVVFLVPDVPVTLKWRAPYRTAREEIEARVEEAILTLRARNGESRIVTEARNDPGEWVVGTRDEPTLVVLTHGTSLFRSLHPGGASLVGPSTLRSGGVYGELSAAGDNAAAVDLAMLAGLCAPDPRPGTNFENESA